MEELTLYPERDVLDLDHNVFFRQDPAPPHVPALSDLGQPDNFDLEELDYFCLSIVAVVLDDFLNLVHLLAFRNLF